MRGIYTNNSFTALSPFYGTIQIMTERITGVLWDVDGTMVNSEPLHVSAWDKALQERGHQLSNLSQEVLTTMAGKKPISIAGEMVRDLHLQINPEELLLRKSSLFMASIATDLEEMPGLVESVTTLKEKGYRLAIGTSMTHQYVQLVLERFHLEDFFEAIVTGDEVHKGKPDPETYLLVAEKLALDSKNCAVIEDATSGVLAANGAGSICIAIRNPNAVVQDLSKADAVIDDLREIVNILKSINTNN